MEAHPAITPDIRGKLRGGSADRAIAELAARQQDIVHRRQLLALDIDGNLIDRRLGSRRLRRIYRGVYTVRQAPLHREGWWMAAVLLGGDGAVLSHRSGAALEGIWRGSVSRIEVTVPTERRQCKGVRFHYGRIEPDEITTVDGIPVTGISRTLLDLAAVLPIGQVESAVAEAEVRRLSDTVTIGQLLARYPTRRGAAKLRRLIETGASRTRSELEVAFLALIDAEGLPRPETNVWLPELEIEADCLWREQRVIVELDGHAVHRTSAAFERDRARDRALHAAGWRPVRVAWRHVHEGRAALVADLWTLLRQPLQQVA